MTGPVIIVERVIALPDQFNVLRSEAAAGGFSNMESLFAQWQDNSNRFERPGEMLVTACVDGELAGIGGITQDFVDPTALRMRRFYIRQSFRRRGIGRAIATFALGTAMPLGREIFVYAETSDAAAFWEAMGFVRIERAKTSHQLPTAGANTAHVT